MDIIIQSLENMRLPSMPLFFSKMQNSGLLRGYLDQQLQINNSEQKDSEHRLIRKGTHCDSVSVSSTRLSFLSTWDQMEL